ncbi:hypothetical protein N806_29390 [Rhodococcus sp. P27]|nr:hypothetical protein N806_29390 [Rhodococcus sp. P27]
MTIPVAPDSSSEPGKQPPLTMFGPDFPFPYDDYVSSPAGLGSVPDLALGTEVAVIGGGLSGMIAAYELLKVGLKPIVYEADQIGGRMRSVEFDGHPGVVAEMGAMRFPPSSTTLFHYLNELGLQTEEFPNPLAEVTPSTVIDLKGESHYAHTLEDLPPIYTEVAQAWQRTLEEHADLIPLQQAIRDRDTAEIKRIWNDLVVRYDDQTFYGFLAASKHFKSFHMREVFGQVGFGTGGWDTDYPNSILEILRVVITPPTTTTAASWVDRSSCRCGCGTAPRRTWRIGLPVRRSLRSTTARRVPASPNSGVPSPATSRSRTPKVSFARMRVPL